MLPLPTPWTRLGRLGLAGLCCLLMFLSPALPSLSASLFAQTFSIEQESEESAPRPIEDDDDDSDNEKSTSSSSRAARNRSRSVCVAPSWRAHLPHHHDSLCGLTLPAATPFGRGCNPPLRC